MRKRDQLTHKNIIEGKGENVKVEVNGEIYYFNKEIYNELVKLEKHAWELHDKKKKNEI